MGKPISALFKFAAAQTAFCAAGLASQPIPPATQVSFHQPMIENLQSPGPNLGNTLDVFAHVYRALPDKITVYPSEGYYYYQFYAGQDSIRGNLRFDVQDRKRGRLSFAYYYDQNAQNAKRRLPAGEGRFLDQRDGVLLTQLSEFEFQLEFKGRSVFVTIYDARMEHATPPKLERNEHLIGPVFDESGVRFHLIFNDDISQFYYVLNDQFGHPESYQRLPYRDDKGPILVGTRTGFAFFQDFEKKRLYLVGVRNGEALSNSYFDGPFDQLPDSFMDADGLAKMIEASNPAMKGKVAAYGDLIGADEVRYAISPYIQYAKVSELDEPEKCASLKNSTEAVFLNCLFK